MPLSVFDCVENEEGWGPSAIAPQFSSLPFTLYNKADKNYRMIDFSYKSSNPKADVDIKEGYSTVDNIGIIRPKKSVLSIFFIYEREKNIPTLSATNTSTITAKTTVIFIEVIFRRRNIFIKYDPSITIRSEWSVMDTLSFADISKFTSEIPEVQDVTTGGRFLKFRNAIEGIYPKKPITLPKTAKDFHLPTAKDDPVIQKLAEQNIATIFATDEAIAYLSCSSRSIYPWYKVE